MSKTLLAIDQGTTSSRAILFSNKGEILALRQKELTLHYPQRGWVEQDPEDIWEDTLWACRSVLEETGEENIAAIGITNQRETTIIWDRKTGKPIYNAIVWQDRRTADRCARLKEQGHEKVITEKTGLLIDPYFSATKIAWILDHVTGARARAEQGALAFGSIDCFLLWRLTAGQVHATDASNAARTMLFNIQSQEWDKELLALLDIPAALLPEVKDNAANFGQTTLLQQPLMIGGMAGDQQAALIGQACFKEGMIKSTYGTGCFALMNIGTHFKRSQNRLLTTVGYRLNGQVTYVLEGSIFIAGAALQWLRDGLGLFTDATESEALALSVADNNGVYFVPAFTGLGAPYWQPAARGLITGLGRESTAAHLTRAALEAQGYQTRDLMDAMCRDSGVDPSFIRIDGGLVANEFVCQFLADMLDKPIEIPQVTESTAWGAAALAGLQAGVFNGLSDIAGHWSAARRYAPQMDATQRAALYKGWKNAIQKVL
ncbi:glycerol kinase [Nitrosomonas cryotolerans]|uniref:Glycerol kinase n=1 Tax=Nitrosomonas cryotolerans ATCC 49181 TaxID=1131553 RepID=A0A1N6HWC9_9PROT|nr:glycerol kinase GlpK [Nitrosomonas cryotolerans]SFQ11049.1 glycerol kinase [Nitrosomonas cryotolerans]SIO23925.1 glycerol kinase [Nitrosomonas cryotolerans ATCC 49181]